MRYPALNPDGSQIAFSYQGDIWTVPATGGMARRLTIHESYESNPQWSPDGQQLLFQGNRFGNDDLFVMDTQGSRPKRMTYYSGSDGAANWHPDGNIIFNTRRFFAAVERHSEVYSVPASGGTPQRMLDAVGDHPVASPDGRYIAFERGSCRVAREAYRGPANRNIWLYDTQTGTYTQLTEDEGQDIYPDWGPDNTLYFLSARQGRYNLYKMNITGGTPEALTNFKDEGIRHFDLSADGKKIVIERGVNISTMDANGRNATAVEVMVTKDYRFDPEEKKTLSSDASEFALSPNGKYISFSLRGELFVYPEDKDKKRANRITNHAARDQDVAWLNDSTLVFISDREGNRDLFMATASAKDSSDLYRAFRFDIKPLTTGTEEENDFMLSPDRQQIVFMQGRGKMLVRSKPRDVDAAGIEHVPRVTGVQDGKPVLADGRVVDVANVVWATGFEPGFDWLDLDVMGVAVDGTAEPRLAGGIVEDVPGLYFVGLDGLYAASSGQIHGVGRDAARVVAHLAARRAAREPVPV